MMLKRGKTSMVGVDIGSNSVKAVELQGKGSDLQLLNLGFETLQADSVVDGQIMELNAVSNAISSIFNTRSRQRKLQQASTVTQSSSKTSCCRR